MRLALILLGSLPALAHAKSGGLVHTRIGELVSQLKPALASAAKPGTKLRLAVLELENVTEGAKKRRLGRTLSEMLAAKLASSGVELVERQRLDKLAEELKLGMSGAVDPATAKQVGKLAAADAILSGSVSEIGGYYDVSVRLVSVSRGKVLASGVVDIEKEAVEGAAPAGRAAADGRSLQEGLDSMETALMAYAVAHVEGWKVRWPAKLEELAPKYLDRIPEAGEGSWVYDPGEGRVSHSARPELKPTQPRLKLQTLLDENKKVAIRGALVGIGQAIMVFYAQNGSLPRRFESLPMEPPPSFDGTWGYDPKTGEVWHSFSPDLRWKPARL